MERLCLILGFAYSLQLVAKWLAVICFFRRPSPPPAICPTLISVLQPILSGDPTLPRTLTHNLHLHQHWPVEFLWLVDEDDDEAQRICYQIANEHASVAIQIVALPRPEPRHSPKMVKLQAGMEIARGDVLCVLDDDTMLPDSGLEECLAQLARDDVGLAFGLPYYVHFATWPSSLIAVFVNSQSLQTYVPYTYLTSPFTINGMFYMMRRDRLAAVGGLTGLETILADDFAVASRFRSHGLRLAQTRLRHGISTHVASWRAYLRLLQRWLVFPRESVMKQLSWYNLIVAYSLAFVPTIAPLVVLLLACFALTKAATAMVAICVLLNFAMFAHFNWAYLRLATPWSRSWLVPVMQFALPLQLMAALVLPQRIVWRGHVMQVDPGGTFTMVRHRNEAQTTGGG